MKKSKISLISVLLLVSMVIFGALLTACPTEAEENSGDASAVGITLAGAEVELAEANSKWSLAGTGRVTIDPGYAANAAVVVNTTESGSSVKYALVDRAETVPVFGAESTFTVANNNYLYVEITAGGGNVLYYFFQVKLVYSQVTLKKLTVAGVTAILENPAPTAATADEGKVTLTPAEATGALAIEVTKSDDGQTLRFAKQAPGPGEPVFTAAPNPLEYTFNSGDYLYIEVTDKSGTFKYYYKIKVVIGSNDASLVAPITVGDPDAPTFTITDVSKGKATYSLTPGDVTTVANAATADLGRLRVTATPTDAGASVKYAISRSDPAAEPVFGTQSELDFNLGSTWLDIQVTAPNGVDVRYYRYRINIGASVNTLAANSLKITQGATEITGNPGVPNGDPLQAIATVVNGLTGALTGATVTVDTTDPNATLEYAITNNDALMPVYGTANTFDFSIANTWLFIRVTAQNGVFTNYRFKVSGSTVNTLQSGTQVSIGSVTTNFGTPNAAYNSAAVINVNTLVAPLTAAQVVATPTTGSGAVVAYAITKGANDGPVFDGSDRFNFSMDNTWLYVRVTAISGDITYYRFKVSGSTDNTLTGQVSIGGTNYAFGIPNATATSAAAVTVVLGTSAVTGAHVVATPANAGASVKYAVAPDGVTVPSFGTVDTFNFALGATYLYVQVTAASGDITYYRFLIGVGDDGKTIGTVTVNGITPTLGTSNSTFVISAGNKGAVTVASLTGVTVAASALEATATVDWGRVTPGFFGGPDSVAAYGTTPLNFGTEGEGYFVTTYTDLVIRITAQNGTQVFYRIVVTL